jgi:hypothetical protein
MDCGLERRVSKIIAAVGVSTTLQQKAHHISRSITSGYLQQRLISLGGVWREAVSEQESSQRGVVGNRAVDEPRHFLCVWSAAQLGRKVGSLTRRGGAASVERGVLGTLSRQGSLGHLC